ncbi:hypothetical protein POM88_039551 [Heracleum sosnowskyi]|uniref:Uncharacterized protein n=1 Tax=Heracleum sosnowskyi TaxID=360622 RepID=A0AAD8M6I0_9APIA|nr:hypothetical protein POM88_039551 [Heracleum sosnowskyi]
MSFLVTTATVRRGHLVSAASNNATTHRFTEIQTRMKSQLIARIANQFFPLLRTPPIMHPLLTERVCERRQFLENWKEAHNSSVHRNISKKEDATYYEKCLSVFSNYPDAVAHASKSHGESATVMHG